MNFIKSTLGSVLKYSIWALAWYGLANFFSMIYLNFLDFINSGIFNKSVKILIGVIVSLLAIVMLTVVSISIAGKISKLICVNLMKIKSLKNDSFELPDMPDISGIFETTPEEKYLEFEKERKEFEMELENKERIQSSAIFREYEEISEKIESLRSERSGLGYGLLNMFNSPEEIRKDEYKIKKIDEHIHELELEKYRLKEKIRDMGGNDLL